MILPGLVYKSSSLPPISEHFLPQSNSGWSYSWRSLRGLAATILKRENHLLVLQYKCKYGHLRTAGLWIMEAGCPWYSWEGYILPLKNRERKLRTSCTVLLFSSALICTQRRQTPVRKETAAVTLPDAVGLWLSSLVFLIPFSLRSASKMLLERNLLQFVIVNK